MRYLAAVVPLLVAAPVIFAPTIALADDPEPAGATPTPPTATPPTPPSSPIATPIATTRVATNEHSIEPSKPLLLPGVLAGAGLVVITTGILVAVTAPDTPASCNSDTKTCARLPGQTNEAFSDDQDRAGRAHTQPIAGWLTVGVGGMLIAAGVLSYFMGDRRSRSRVAASVGPSGGGFSVVRTF